MTPRSLTLSLLALALALTQAVPAMAASDIDHEQILAGYTLPVQVTSARGVDDVLYVVEQGGKIKRALFRDGAWHKRGVFLDISDRVNAPTGFIEQGILGVAFHPRYKRNGRLYVAYTRKTGDERDGDSVVSEFRRRSRTEADPSSERRLIVVKQPEAMHSVANLAFGPDGLLYIGSGDGGVGKAAQDRGTKLGKILRIDPRDPDGRGPERFTVPDDNPYVGRRGADVIWASGVRNPWRFSFDRKTGHLWIGDVGEGLREEVDRSKADRSGRNAGRGANYGWYDCEGSLELHDDEGDADGRCEQGTLPLFEYGHADHLCAIIGGHVLRGRAAGTWGGLYVAADSCGWLFVLDAHGRARISKRTPGGGIVSLGEDSRGRLYAVVRHDGTLHRIVRTGERP